MKTTAMPGVILFDLDNTLYAPETGLIDLVDRRMDECISRSLGLSIAESRALRRRLREHYGHSLLGFRAETTLDIEAFLIDAHDPVPVEERLAFDPELHATLTAIPVDKVVFTNAPRRWARRVLATLRIEEQFRHVCDLEFLEYHGKPHPEAFRRVLAHLGCGAEACVLVEDMPRNLVPAKALGMTTVLVAPPGTRAECADYVVSRAAEVAEVIATISR
jgi:putative hydrolase of the HAD superfamily